jgi:hypothetical protein
MVRFLAFVLPFLCAGVSLAQDAAPNQAEPQPPSTNSAGEAAVAPPPEIVPSESDQNSSQEFQGPAVLSRPFMLSPMRSREIRFRPYFSLAGVADDGLTNVSTTKDGQFVNQEAYGIEAGFGITGRRVFKRDQVGLEFHGNLYHYTPNSFYDGGNYVLDFRYEHLFSKHFRLALTETGGLYSNNYSLVDGITDLSLGNTNFVVTPNTQLFDNRSLYLSTGADLVWEKSARLSFDFGGSGFIVRRRSSSLYGTVGSQARADMSYRLTKRLTVGGYYGYTHYDFNRAFGGSDVQTGGIIYSYAFSRNLELRLRAGGSRVESQGTQTVLLDPVIAAILGQTQGVIAIHRINYLPDISAQLWKKMRRGYMSVEYLKTVTPGNGLYLTSRRDTYAFNYDYTGLKRYTFSGGFNRDTLNSLGISIGSYASNNVHGGVTRVLGRGFQASLRAEYRHYDITDANFLRNSYRISAGVVWTPDERPLKLW